MPWDFGESHIYGLLRRCEPLTGNAVCLDNFSTFSVYHVVTGNGENVVCVSSIWSSESACLFDRKFQKT